MSKGSEALGMDLPRKDIFLYELFVLTVIQTLVKRFRTLVKGCADIAGALFNLKIERK